MVNESAAQHSLHEIYGDAMALTSALLEFIVYSFRLHPLFAIRPENRRIPNPLGAGLKDRSGTQSQSLPLRRSCSELRAHLSLTVLSVSWMVYPSLGGYLTQDCENCRFIKYTLCPRPGSVNCNVETVESDDGEISGGC